MRLLVGLVLVVLVVNLISLGVYTASTWEERQARKDAAVAREVQRLRDEVSALQSENARLEETLSVELAKESAAHDLEMLDLRQQYDKKIQSVENREPAYGSLFQERFPEAAWQNLVHLQAETTLLERDRIRRENEKEFADQYRQWALYNMANAPLAYSPYPNSPERPRARTARGR
jgi:hypothetical protein